MACYGNIYYGPTAGDEIPDLLTNACLPTTGKPQLLMTPVYGDDGVSIIYYEYTLNIEIVIYEQNKVLADIEAEVRRLRLILGTPGYQLVIYPVGLGTFPVINGPTVIDVKGGPYPQEVYVEPIASNNAILVRWKLLFRILHCPLAISQFQPIQFNSELDIDTDDEGDIVFLQKFTLQQAAPITDYVTLSALLDTLIQQPNRVFNGMRKRKRMSFSRDRRVAHLEVKYTQMKSSNALLPFTRNIECTDEISSTLLPSEENAVGSGGFFKWDRHISATITLPDRMHKAYAYIFYLKIIQERFKGMNVIGAGTAIPQAKLDPVQEADTVRKNWYILTKVKVTNGIYTRQMKFDFSYLMLQSLATIMTKSNILARVNNGYNQDGSVMPLSEQWRRWDDTQNLHANGQGMYEPSPYRAYPNCTESLYPIFDHKVLVYATAVDTEYEINPMPEYSKYTLPKENSYIDYNNDYQILEENNNIGVNYLQPLSSSSTYYKTMSTNTRDFDGCKLHGYSDDPAPGSFKQETIVRGLAKYQIRMKGYAIRAGYRIPFPDIKSVNGIAVSRTGQARYSQKQANISDSIPTYLAMWDVTYNVDGNIYSNDIFSTIVGSGDPSYFI